MLTMSSVVRNVIQRFASMQLSMGAPTIKPRSLIVPHINTIRMLYCKASLGIDNFEIQKQRTKEQLSNLQDKFKERMKEYIADDKNMIFTEDLKNMVYLTETEEDLELLMAMMKRFNKQNKQLRFGDFKFGPIVMRLFHILNKPKVAMECFKDEQSFPGFFDQLITFQVYLDLLYENGMYEEVVQGFRQIESKQLEGALFPRNSFVITLAACYKMNTKESYENALSIWNKGSQHGYYPTRRSVTFCAGLALKQNHPEVALELISSSHNQNYTTIRNIKALALSKMGRLEEAIAVLKSVLTIERGEHTFNQDVIDGIKQAILASENSEISVEFNRIEQLLQKQGNITNKTLDEQLCSEIQKPPQKTKDMGGNFRNNFNQRQTLRPSFNRTRPGLQDMI